MRPPAASAPAEAAALPLLRALAPALLLALVIPGLLFHAEIAAAIAVWNSSTAYGHCWLVVPIVLWLLWERRDVWRRLSPRPARWPALLCLPLGLVWLAANVVGVMEARQFAAVLTVECLLLALLGPRLWWALSAALLYLLFLVPTGAFLVPALQDFTAGFVARGLDLLAIPNRVTALSIDIPEGGFYVAEACAGLRFLIASIAFGVLYAVTMFRSPARRVLYVALACVVPVIANGFRALGIVVLGHVLGSAEAAAADHVIYGWVFFSFVIVLLALAGLPFRQDEPVAAEAAGTARPGQRAPLAPPTPGLGRRALLAVWVALLAAASGPALSLVLDRPGAPGLAEALLVPPPGCDAGGSRVLWDTASQDFICGQSRITARLRVLPLGANPWRVTGAAAADVTALLPRAELESGQLPVEGGSPARWALRSDRKRGEGAATVFWLEGVPGLGGVRDRLRMAEGRLRGSRRHPISLVVAVSSANGLPEDALRGFLLAQGDLAARLAALSAR